MIVIGGGLAGLATAVGLAPLGFRVRILESRTRLGGRAGSFTDATSQQVVDACQHVSMGCCTRFARFCQTLGIEKYLEPQPTLYFMTPDGRISRFAADRLPAPFHLARAFANAHYLTLGDKLRIARGMWHLMRANPDDDPPLLPWLKVRGQTARTISRFWNVVLISALNDVVENLGLKYARKVFVDGFLTDRKGFEVQLPTVPLAKFYGEEMLAWFATHQVKIDFNAGVSRINIDGGRVAGLTLRDGRTVDGDIYVSAVPFDRLLDLLPEEVIAAEPIFSRLKQMRVSPITSIHLWFDRKVMTLPHLVLLDSVGQWIFNRGGDYLQVVVSASEHLEPLGREKILDLILDEVRSRLPSTEGARLVHHRVITEHRATFRAFPGVDALRPMQATPIPNLFLAGDWTQTGWPATMEGAVRSGYLASEAILRYVDNH